MREYFYSLIAKILVFIGAMVIFIPMLVCWIIWNTGGDIPELFEEYIIILGGFIVLGGSMIFGGGRIERRYGKIEPFLAKDGGPIHSGRAWKKGSESGLFQTWCGLLVSTNRESGATAHVGYRIVPAKRTTCKDCVQREVRAILDTHILRGE